MGGIVKDGAVSGFLPSAEAFAVHYPGYPSSTARAIETLGGAQAILKARSSRPSKLELHFRPEDPYSHPAFGELQPCNNFLLKLSRTAVCNFKKSSDSCETMEELQEDLQDDIDYAGVCEKNEEVEVDKTEEVHANLSAEIVARVPEAYHFTGMVDYQYVLPVHADDAHKKKRSWMEMEQQLGKGDLVDSNHEDSLILLPPLFSLKDAPENIVLRPTATLSSKKKLEGVIQQRWEMDIEPCLAIDFNTEKTPKKVNWESYIAQGSEQWELQLAVAKLFEERPVWPKDALNERLLDQNMKVGDYMFKRLLFRAAYYFSNGPFLRFWIRKGYDPRKDNESRIYQRIDFRVPPSLRSYCEDNTARGLKRRWKDLCEFRYFPYKCQTSLQLFELADEYIQEEIRKPSKQTTYGCSEQCATGWFSDQILRSLRLRVQVRFLSVYPESGVDILLKSASVCFEKSKKMRLYKDDLRSEGHQNDNRGDDDKEADDVGDEEDEIEVEDEDDLDEALMAGEEGETPLPQAYLDDYNISKNYLQELFGTFPSNELNTNDGLDANASNGEYEIYEPYSEVDYSDGEDN